LGSDYQKQYLVWFPSGVSIIIIINNKNFYSTISKSSKVLHTKSFKILSTK